MEERQREALASYSRRVPAVVEDAERAEALLRLGERVVEELRVETAALEALAARFDALHRDYHATREDLEAALAAVEAQRRRIRALLLSGRGEAVSLTTASEWEAIATRESTVLSLTRQSGDLF